MISGDNLVPGELQPSTIYGIVGIIRLISGNLAVFLSVAILQVKLLKLCDNDRRSRGRFCFHSMRNASTLSALSLVVWTLEHNWFHIIIQIPLHNQRFCYFQYVLWLWLDYSIYSRFCSVIPFPRSFPGPYIAVITEREEVGHINGHVIWAIKGTNLLPYAKTMLHLTETQV